METTYDKLFNAILLEAGFASFGGVESYAKHNRRWGAHDPQCGNCGGIDLVRQAYISDAVTDKIFTDITRPNTVDNYWNARCRADELADTFQDRVWQANDRVMYAKSLRDQYAHTATAKAWQQALDLLCETFDLNTEQTA